MVLLLVIYQLKSISFNFIIYNNNVVAVGKPPTYNPIYLFSNLNTLNFIINNYNVIIVVGNVPTQNSFYLILNIYIKYYY